MFSGFELGVKVVLLITDRKLQVTSLLNRMRTMRKKAIPSLSRLFFSGH